LRAEEVSCGFYLRQRHGLINRHTETITLNADHTALWELQVDFGLPDHDEACWSEGRDEVEEPDESLFLFPLAFLRKSEARLGFEVRDESGALVSVPNREECDRISGFAAAQASEALLGTLTAQPDISPREVTPVIEEIAAAGPFRSAMALRRVFQEVGLESGRQVPSEVAALGQAWDENGLREVLQMLVDHTLVWVPIRGRRGERRSLVLSQEISLTTRVFLRWIFGELTVPDRPYLHPFKTWRAVSPLASSLRIGDRRYGRRTYRISFSALAERIGQPLGWSPFEYEFPTVYTKRCRTYHFEVICPPGRSPRDLRVATGTPLAEPSHFRKGDESEGRTTVTPRRIRHDRAGGRSPFDIWLRVTVGVGDGALPVLWFLSGAITALILWVIAAHASQVEEQDAQVTAAILLIVPVLVAGLAISDNTVPITRLIPGARILLLIIGLCPVMASAVLIQAEPLSFSPKGTWTACAVAATVATMPLATGSLLSSSFVWRQLKRLKSHWRQMVALRCFVSLALAITAALILLCGDLVSRGLLGVCLILLAIAMTVVANTRAAMPIDEARRYISLSLLLAATTCLALGCIELIAEVHEGAYGLQMWAQYVAAAALVVSFVAGWAVSSLTSRYSPSLGEIHVSPRVGRSLLSGEAVRELTILREREEEAARAAERAAKGQAMIE
jgi:hypothetical protein